MLEEIRSDEIEVARPMPMAGPKKFRILVVDDDQEFRLLLSELLVLQGHFVVTAKDGRSALQKLKSEEELPDLIFLDLTMPIMDGWKFCEAKSADPETDGIPVVMISGHDIPRSLALKNKVDACLTKPFDVFQVLDVVGKVLPMT